MKLVLVVFVALGLTMAWQASVVADYKTEQELAPRLTVGPAETPTVNHRQRG